MNTINFDSLRHAILEVLDESIQELYDINRIIKSAKPVWDDTAVQVKSNDFVMIFDLRNYELQNYEGYDL